MTTKETSNCNQINLGKLEVEGETELSFNIEEGILCSSKEVSLLCWRR